MRVRTVNKNVNNKNIVNNYKAINNSKAIQI